MTPVNMECCTSPLSRLVLIEHSIELFVLALMQPGEYGSAFCAFTDAFTTTELEDNLLCIVFFVFYTGFHHCLKLFQSKIYVNLTAITCLLSKCSHDGLLCNSIRLVEKLPVALLWSLMKLLTCLTSKQATDVCMCVRVRSMSERWRWKLVWQWWERQADSAVMVSGMGGDL